MTELERLKIEGEYNEALMNAQAELKPVEKSTKGIHGAKYPIIEDCQREYTPVLAKHGLVVIHRPDFDSESGVQYLITELRHKNGWKTAARIPIKPQDEHNPQKVGSFITYMKRYQGNAIVGLITKGEDDDGDNFASTKQPAQNRQTQPPRNQASKNDKPCTPKQAQAARVMLSKFYGGNSAQCDSYLMKAYSYTMDDDGKPSCKRLKWADASNLISRLKIELEKKESTEPENENQDTGFAEETDQFNPPF